MILRYLDTFFYISLFFIIIFEKIASKNNNLNINGQETKDYQIYKDINYDNENWIMGLIIMGILFLYERLYSICTLINLEKIKLFYH